VGSPAVCEVATLQNAKHEPPRGSGACPPENFFKNACFEIESGTFYMRHKIDMLRTGSGSLP